MNGTRIADVEAVIHGHSGTDGDLIWVDENPFVSISDSNENIINTDVTVTGSNDIKVQFVLANTDGTGISTQTTLIEFNKVALAEIDTTPPSYVNAFINAAKDKIYLHFNEELDPASVPDASCFTLANSGTITVSNVSVVNTQDNARDKGYVILTLSGAISDITNLKVSYTQPGSSALQDKATTPNKVMSLVERVVNIATVTAGPFFVSSDGQYIIFNTTNAYYLFNSGSPSLTLKYGADSANASVIPESNYSMNYSFSNNGTEMTFNIKLNSPPTLVTGGKYYIDLGPNGCTDFAFDTGATITNAEGIPANEQALGDPTSVVYYTAANEITAIFDTSKLSNNWNTNIQGCFITLNVNGRSYLLRGLTNLRSYNGTLVITQSNVPFDMLNSMSDATLSLSTASHVNDLSIWEYLTYPSGKPYEGFSNIPITIQ
jgi:hypothetical protein